MFILYSTDDDRQLPTEYLPCGAIQPKYGMAMYMTSGKLAVASAGNAAEYICLRQEDAAVTAGTIIPVAKIQKDQIWSTEAAATGLAVGAACDVASGGLTVAATASGGAANFVLTAVDGTDVRGRFVK